MLYNENVKAEFIEYKKENTVLPSKNYLENIFESVAEEEKRLNKDVNSFTVTEIIDYYKKLNKTSLEELQNINSTLSGYFKFCFDKNYITELQNPFMETKDINLLSQCVNNRVLEKKLLTRKQVLSICRAGFISNPMDQFIILGLFEGLETEDLCLAEKNDFDEDSLIYKSKTGKIFQISKELYEYARQAWEETDYYYYGGEREGKSIKFIPSQLCVKSHRDTGKSKANYRRKIHSRVNQVFDNVVTEDGIVLSEIVLASTLRESGMIDYIKQRLKELNITFEEYMQGSQYTTDMRNKNYILYSKKKVYTKYRLYFESTS